MFRGTFIADMICYYNELITRSIIKASSHFLFSSPTHDIFPRRSLRSFTVKVFQSIRVHIKVQHCVIANSANVVLIYHICKRKLSSIQAGSEMYIVGSHK